MDKIKTTYAINLLIGLSLAGTFVFGIGVLNSWWISDTSGNAEGVIGAITNAFGFIGTIFVLGAIVIILGILFITNLIFTVVNIKQHAPPLAYLFAWGPILLALTIALIGNNIKEAKKEAYEQSHPNIEELHINLSGKHLWISETGAETMLANPPEQFSQITRYAGGGDKMIAYQGSRLAESYKDISIYASNTESADDRTVLTLPVFQSKTYPDVTSIIPKIGSLSAGFKPTEASILVYQYFYYPDRVEVAPALSLAGSDSMDLWGADVPLVNVNVSNYQAQAIARLEIDGQSLSMKYQSLPIKIDVRNCFGSKLSAPILNTLNAPLKVRWQFLEPNPAWHEAVVKVPQFPALKSKPDWKKRDTGVYLYFLKDGSVAAQWQQVVTFKDEKKGIRTTEVSPKLPEPAACGTAEDNWGDETVRIHQ